MIFLVTGLLSVCTLSRFMKYDVYTRTKPRFRSFREVSQQLQIPDTMKSWISISSTNILKHRVVVLGFSD